MYDNGIRMPICLKSLEVRNYRGINNLKIKKIPVDAKWIVLTGENGFGKTSILQSIAIGLHGTIDGSTILLDSEGFVMLEAKKNDKNFFNLSYSYDAKTGDFKSVAEIAVYGSTRLSNVKENNGSDSDSIIGNLFAQESNLINIERELIETNAYNESKFKLLREVFCKLIPDMHDIRVDNSNGKPYVKYIEHDINGNSYQEIAFKDLAMGFRNIINLAGDIISRLSSNQKNILDISQLQGIVIIDEIELHLHPKYQKFLPKALSEIFPKVQFIVSTHSPIPLLGMPKETVIIKVNRTKEEGITAEKLDIDFADLLPNAILSSPIFGFQEIIPDANNSSKNIRTEDDYSEVLFNEQLEKKIESIKNKYKRA